MPIGLNYTYKTFDDGSKLLPSYIYLLDNVDDITTYDQQHIKKHVLDGKLLGLLEDPKHDSAFDDPLIRKIHMEAYPYQMQMKFAGLDIADDTKRNERLISHFNDFFHTDYHKVIDTYCQECNRELAAKTFLAHEKERYDDVVKASTLCTDFLLRLLDQNGYAKEADGFQRFIHTSLKIKYTPGISGNTSYDGDTVIIEVGNNTYTTLFHELTHAINRFFRMQYFDESIVCYENLTKSNEGLANFLAYHLLDVIKEGDIDAIENIDLDPIFFSMYIDIYATTREFGSNDRKHNFDLVYQELKKFEGDLLTDDKAKFYYERFYKFFHYDQHQYFYPKELMYYLGYHEMLGLFKDSKNKSKMLIDCFLGKICL